MRRFIFLILGVSLLVSGCGYTTRSLIAEQYRTIHIDPFGNQIDITRDTDVARKYKIYKPGIETSLTRAVVSKYLFDGNLRPVEKGTADLVLHAEVIEFRRDPLRYTDNDEVEEYRLNLVISMTLYDTRAEKLLWEEKGFTGDTTYFTLGPSAKSEDIAINDAVNDLARRIVERTVEQW